MIQFIRKSESQFVCVIDDDGVNQMVGKDIDATLKNSATIKLLVKETVEKLCVEYNLDTSAYDIGTMIYRASGIVIAFSVVPMDSEVFPEILDEDEEDDNEYEYEASAMTERTQVHVYNKPMYMISDIEHIINLQQDYGAFNLASHTLYSYKNKLVLHLDTANELVPEVLKDLQSIFSEYAVPVDTLTEYYLDEYAKVVTTDVPSMVDILTNKRDS